MEPHILLAQLRALLARTPDFTAFTPASALHHQWLGQAHALIGRWSQAEAATFQNSVDFLAVNPNYNLGRIFGSINRAVADLELRLPVNGAQAFGPGAIYDFFKALNDVLSSANASIFITDPYLDDTVFDAYLSSAPKGVAVRLLIATYSEKLKPASERFVAQHGTALEVRKSTSIHDRVIFVDGSECWVLGQSIKDAASKKPTYLAPLPPDVSAAKLGVYEDLWAHAVAI